VRWALSYLRGPLTRQQIQQLMGPVKASEGSGASPAAAAVSGGPESAPSRSGVATPETVTPGPAIGARPLLPPDIPQFFLPLQTNRPERGALLYRPMVLGCASVSFVDAKAGIDTSVPAARLAPLPPDALTVDWSTAVPVETAPDDLDKEPAADAGYDTLPAAAAKVKSYTAWTKSFVDAVFRTETLELRRSASLRAVSQPGEMEREFRVRLQQAAKEARDAELDRLRAKYATKIASLEEKRRKAELAVRREQDQARNAGLSSFVRMGSTLLGAFMSRKTLSTANINKAGTALRNVGQTMKESGDVTRAQETLASINEEALRLDSEFVKESRRLEQSFDPLKGALQTVTIKPKKANVVPKLLALVWAPHWSTPGSPPSPAWR
jgi:hypothetical protein